MPTISEIIAQYQQAVEVGEINATSRLVAAYRRVYTVIKQDADALQAVILAKAQAGEKVSQASIYRLVEYQRLMATIKSNLERYGVIVEDTVMQGIQDAVPKGAALGREMVQGMLDGLPPEIQASIMATFNRMPDEAIQAMVGALQQTSPLQKITLSRFPETTAKAVSEALVRGLASGVGPRRVADVMRTILGIPLTDGLRIARTEIGRAFNSAALASYRANPHVVKGWRWSAELGPRTCMACIALNGQLFPLEDEFADHPNGRCAPVPETISMAELGLNIPETRPEMQSGEDWFKEQPESVQRGMMGPGKYEAWKAGQFQFSQLIHTDESPDWGRTFTEASLKEILGEAA